MVSRLSIGMRAARNHRRVVIDATVVRLVLVPSAMFLIGRANRWMPRRLDRVLPRLHA
jgi:RND superfamily putative drug exporter